ncbi:MAG: 4-hydroxy-tetrahydrodipicolinate reductase [Flavobacteriales bacterium]|jgi:4-hydroxy-tetrahydrodipicolinate reductase
MRIAIIGYGKMGKEIESVIMERGHEVAARLGSLDMISPQSMNQADVAIEFTRPDQVLSNLETCIDLGIPVVTGTTGWNEHLPHITARCLKGSSGLFHASNFSIGVNIFFELNKRLAQMMNNQNDYSASMVEIHHTEKLDAPSGTAITLAEGLISEIANVNSWDNNETKDTGVLHIASQREPEVTGTHTMTYGSGVDQISIEHKALNRKGFAIGAVKAAEWLIGKQGVFTMKDMIKI